MTQIYHWRRDEQLAYKVIAERLNHDLDRYPPPQPHRRDQARRRWTVSAVRAVLTNPKYTGYMVWNRRASKSGGAHNAPDRWIWSADPTHEPLVTLHEWKTIQDHIRERQGSRNSGTNSHPATRRTYALRSYVHCGLCHKRMFGKTRKGLAYYTCQPQLDRVGNPDDYTDHPRSIYVREDRLLDCVRTFFTERVFGADRTELLRAQLADHDTQHHSQHEQRIAALEKTVTNLARRQDNILDEREAASTDTNDPATRAWAERLRARFTELEKERLTKQTELDQLRASAHQTQTQKPELLDQLPRLAANLTDAPDPLQRALYDACQIKINYDRHTGHVTIHATLRVDAIPTITQNAHTIANNATAPGEKPHSDAPTSTNTVAHVSGAPGRTRTCDLRIRSCLLYTSDAADE